MPKFLEEKLRKEYGNNPKAIYGTMNKIGAMRGNKETAKGRAMEAKHERDMGHDGKKHELPNESPAHERKETKAQEAYEQRTGREIGAKRLMGHDGHGVGPCSNCGTIHWK